MCAKDLEADAGPCYSEPPEQYNGAPDPGFFQFLRMIQPFSGDQGFNPDHGGKSVSNQSSFSAVCILNDVESYSSPSLKTVNCVKSTKDLGLCVSARKNGK